MSREPNFPKILCVVNKDFSETIFVSFFPCKYFDAARTLSLAWNAQTPPTDERTKNCAMTVYNRERGRCNNKIFYSGKN